MSSDEEKLSVLGHLYELRKRLIRCLIAVAITSILSFIFAPQVFEILKEPAGEFNPIFIE
ncbi:twin-arginine translocase subunit TatC, partial [Chloroflexota bacterium]